MVFGFRYTAACGFAGFLLLAGCGNRDGLTEISGRVVYDGLPVEKGTISFLPADGQAPTAATVIAQGKYSVKVSSGPKRVQVDSFKTTGQRPYNPHDPRSPVIDVQEQILPEKYNARSELTCEISPGQRTCDFDLAE